MRAQHERDDAAGFLHVTLGIWLGVYAFRSFVPTAVWNLADAMPLVLKGAVAIAVHIGGMAGWRMPVTRRRNSIVTLAVVVAVTGSLRQLFIADDTIGSTLSLLGWLFWLWWLAALVRTVSQAQARVMAAAFATALSLQVGMQAAWHGLDLPMARGMVAVGCAVLLNMLFALTAKGVAADPATPDAKQSSRVFIVLGIALFLELTLLANVGRVGAITHLGLTGSALLIQIGLLLGIFASTRSSLFVLYASTIVLLLATLLAPRFEGAAGAFIILAQVALVALMRASSLHAQRSAARAFLAGALALFVLIFLFYNWYELPVLWPISALALVMCALPYRSASTVRVAQPLYAVAGMGLTLIGLTGARAATQHTQTRAEARVLTYNIHQGFDALGVPAMQRIADEIAALDADIIALQEVGRGWTFVGGGDLVAYLRYRFPEYQINFVPVNGQLWGVALMSRLPMNAIGGHAFTAPAHTFRYGFAAGTVRIGANAVRVVSVHLTAGLEGNGGDARVDQADQLLRAVAAYDNVIISGDLNAHPNEPPVQRIVSGGYGDAGMTTGLGAIATWPASAPNERIDYVFTRGKLHVRDGSIPRTTASDHLPVVVRVAPQ